MTTLYASLHWLLIIVLGVLIACWLFIFWADRRLKRELREGTYHDR